MVIAGIIGGEAMIPLLNAGLLVLAVECYFCVYWVMREDNEFVSIPLLVILGPFFLLFGLSLPPNF